MRMIDKRAGLCYTARNLFYPEARKARGKGMRLLFVIDQQDHAGCTRTTVRNSARAIIIKKTLAAMVRSAKYGFYKFPGGGIENGESPVEAMIRETREESGLVVKAGSVREYGYVHRVQRSGYEMGLRFVQDNFYYLCEAEENAVAQRLDEYEKEEGYALEFVDPDAAIRANRTAPVENAFERTMIEREARVLELLKAEGLI